jgi:thiosulfate/3-mercaptopyruvate sulfurtransferase
MTIITTAELTEHIDDPDWVIVDCRYQLVDSEKGRRDYLETHIPGAVYAHLDEDLCAPIVPGVTGRHPLPPVGRVVETFSKWGITSTDQVVVYDDAGGALAAGRLWWMLRWLGHDTAVVLDGGWSKWLAEGRPVRSGDEQRERREFIPRLRPELLVDAEEVDARRNDPTWLVVDARASERYRGEVEPIDPVAGHIPGAISLPYAGNLTPEGTFRSVEELRRRYLPVLGDVLPENVAFYCGSGVTAVNDILAMMYAGLGEPKLYPGSWSEWITDPNRPVGK